MTSRPRTVRGRESEAAPPPRGRSENGVHGHFCQPGWWCKETSPPNYGFFKFDNILWAWLAIFICLTMTNWTDLMYQLQACAPHGDERYPYACTPLCVVNLSMLASPAGMLGCALVTTSSSK